MHRDVKPGNIVVDKAGLAHLIDFGIARRTGDSTMTDGRFRARHAGLPRPRGGLRRAGHPGVRLLAAGRHDLLRAHRAPAARRAHRRGVRAARGGRPAHRSRHLPPRSAHLALLRAALDTDPAQATAAARRYSGTLEDWLRTGRGPPGRPGHRRRARPVTAGHSRRARAPASGSGTHPRGGRGPRASRWSGCSPRTSSRCATRRRRRRSPGCSPTGGRRRCSRCWPGSGWRWRPVARGGRPGARAHLGAAVALLVRGVLVGALGLTLVGARPAGRGDPGLLRPAVRGGRPAAAAAGHGACGGRGAALRAHAGR